MLRRHLNILMKEKSTPNWAIFRAEMCPRTGTNYFTRDTNKIILSLSRCWSRSYRVADEIKFTVQHVVVAEFLFHDYAQIAFVRSHPNGVASPKLLVSRGIRKFTGRSSDERITSAPCLRPNAADNETLHGVYRKETTAIRRFNRVEFWDKICLR